MNVKRHIELGKLIISLSLSFLPGIFGTLFMLDASSEWYQSLVKPWFTPPNWVFAPVWTTLYVLIGISFYMVWTTKADKDAKQIAFLYFGTHLLFNGLWTPTFFVLQAVGYALFFIVVLDITVIIMTLVFYEINKKAGFLLVPYIVWLGVATLLNLSISLMN